ncbi:hypothetical protein [Dyadobacter tibetensis]|uniref:hypothetical protein n=1 Tax=Dyadobacter tibetensis TaxID=1211851 RepID=UPI0004700885|nr:hypothetical protein [Dyadobacter tibetensis]
MNIFYTVCNRNSLCHALALAESVNRHHPNDKFVLGWVDDVIPPQLPEGVELMEANKLEIPQWESMKTHYYTYELLPATRPWFASKLINQVSTNDRLIFLAPTMLLWMDGNNLLNRSEDALFTPQITRPLASSEALKDHQILNTGMFHAGSWMLRDTTQTRTFLQWWADRTQDRAFFDLCNGMCMDQLWLNFAPIHIHSWGKMDEDSWHYGLNKIPLRDLSLQGQQPYVGRTAVVATDFAGLTFYDPIWSDYNGTIRGKNGFSTLFNAYQLQLDGLKTVYGLGGNPGYGKIAQISANRNLRNHMAKKIKSITTFIDNY